MIRLTGASDPSDVGARLRMLEDNGEELFRQHCILPLITRFTHAVAGLKARTAVPLHLANSRYADDANTMTAIVGHIGHFEMGLDVFNGRPDGDNVEFQMQTEFSSDIEFITSNYGGVKTSLTLEWEFVVNPRKDKVYPGEVGLARDDGSCFAGRNRKSIAELMNLESR